MGINNIYFIGFVFVALLGYSLATNDLEFQRFITKYGKSYSTQAEYDSRYQVSKYVSSLFVDLFNLFPLDLFRK